MEELTGKDRKTLIKDLRGDIFLNLDRYNPKDLDPFKTALEEDDFARAYVTADEYLSGNIRKKDRHLKFLYRKYRKRAYSRRKKQGCHKCGLHYLQSRGKRSLKRGTQPAKLSKRKTKRSYAQSLGSGEKFLFV